MTLFKFVKIYFFIQLIFTPPLFSQTGFYRPINLDTVSWSLKDFGKMWTFDSVPLQKYEEKFGFNPSQEWLDNVQKSALQFGDGCSGAFISEDGLIMTNHHCGRNELKRIQKEGENILKNGFYAQSLAQERRIKNLYVDQLVYIEDVTHIIKNYMSKGESEIEKFDLRELIKDSLLTAYSKKKGNVSRIVTLYHGGKYSLYGYKRYSDIRLVMAPDFLIAATGWDWDNFTYPRYELDFMFYRAYDDEGSPVKSKNYFRWSENGAEEGELIFVVGRPGSTNRLYSYSQLEYLRDVVYPKALVGFNAIYDACFELYQKHPESSDILNLVMRWGNSRKSYAGRLAGLNNEYIMKKKKSFQEYLISTIKADSSLNDKYGFVWESIDSIIGELSKFDLSSRISRFDLYAKPVYFKLASELLKIVGQNDLNESEKEGQYKSENIGDTISELFEHKIDTELNDQLLKASINFLKAVLDSSNVFYLKFLTSKETELLVDDFKKQSKILNEEGFSALSKLSMKEIKDLEDPFIEYNLFIENINSEISDTVRSLNSFLSIHNELLGEAVFAVFGDKISPDATSTLRISEGMIKGYQYNGTIAPGKTTYYGLWDRYESFNKATYPWGLHERWRIPPDEFDLSVDIGFASTNDIVGGNSGSSVINTNKEVVGLVHDGNIESLAGHTIFLCENNRTVASDSHGLIEALKYVYKTPKLVDEILNGKMPD